jgi:shikimate kinase
MSAHAGGLIVCLVGFPGVGKLTIANALAPKLNAKIVDNHWINDPILCLITDNDTSKAVHESIWIQVAKVREAVLDTISTLAPAEANFIFTYAGANEDPNDHKVT